MAERGGYRAPENPAPVSGPGALSRRTDGALPGAQSGTQAPIEEMRAAGGEAPGPPIDTSSLVPMEADTQNPDQLVTSGAVFEPEANSVGMGEDLTQFRAYLPWFKRLASMPSASPATRQFVRQLERQLRQ